MSGILSEELAGLNDTGATINHIGVVSDWADYPPQRARPSGPKEKRTKAVFTTEEELDLVTWCKFAEVEGTLVGCIPFEELQCLVRF